MLKTEYHGLTPYREMWEYQKKLFQRGVELKKRKMPVEEEYLLLTQHYPVITLGFHADKRNLLFSQETLEKKGVEVFGIERGGDVTYHGPGQLVAYPVIDLERHRLGVKDYVWLMEESVIRLLDLYGIKGERVEGASGVWIGKGTPKERKICALGIKCSHYMTMHGLALNVNTDLGGFSLINPCGFVDKGVTSMAKELCHTVDFEEVAANFDRIFRDLLSE